MANEEQRFPDPDLPPNTKVEAVYREAIAKMSGTERVQRVFSLFAAIQSMVRLRVERAQPGLSEREIRLRMAEIMYQSDPRTLELIGKLRRHDESVG